MKALSIWPEPTMDIFTGEKTIEFRTWQTDYRGDLLICASSKKEPGFVSGHAYMVVPLLNIRPSEEEWYGYEGTTMYDWILGAPKLIQPIPVKGQLHLFDVDDELIHYIDGGDLGAYKTEDEANAIRKAFKEKYLDSLTYHPRARQKVEPKPVKKVPDLLRSANTELPPDDISTEDMIKVLIYLQPDPPITNEYSQRRTDKNNDRRDYATQKAHLIDRLHEQSISAPTKPSTRAVYNRLGNPYAILWLAETLGENPDTLRRIMDATLEADNGRFTNMSRAIRKAIPFERIVELLYFANKWLIDRSLLPYIKYRLVSRQPFMAGRYKDEFYEVLHKEQIHPDDPSALVVKIQSAKRQN